MLFTVCKMHEENVLKQEAALFGWYPAPAAPSCSLLLKQVETSALPLTDLVRFSVTQVSLNTAARGVASRGESITQLWKGKAVFLFFFLNEPLVSALPQLHKWRGWGMWCWMIKCQQRVVVPNDSELNASPYSCLLDVQTTDNVSVLPLASSGGSAEPMEVEENHLSEVTLLLVMFYFYGSNAQLHDYFGNLMFNEEQLGSHVLIWKLVR